MAKPPGNDLQLPLFGEGSPQPAKPQRAEPPAKPAQPKPAQPKPAPPAPSPAPAPAREPPRRPAPPPAPEILSVASLDRLIKRVIESTTADVLVQGEVSGLRQAGSGHLYFSLKDEREDAIIDCVMYRTAPIKARRSLRDGESVVLAGRVTLYAPRGRLQFIADNVLQTARGALLEALEKLKERLAAEGLFAPDRKKPLPGDARRIAVLTSRTGAAIHDIVRVAFARGRVHIFLVSTPVQGQGAPERIARAIAFADRLGLDALIVARGGGSAEDLACYNDEIVVRAIAGARTPIISAVGHEIDTSLADLAADARAATPSQAAEMIVPDDRARYATLEHLAMRLTRSIRHGIVAGRETTARLATRVGEPRRLLLEQSQRFDDLGARMERALTRSLAARRARLEAATRRLHAEDPRHVLGGVRVSLTELSARIDTAMRRDLTAARHRLAQGAAQLDALSPLAVLSRGYAIVTAADHVVFDAARVAPGDPISVRLHRGRVEASVTKTKEDPAKAK